MLDLPKNCDREACGKRCLLLRALAQIERRPDFLVFIENSAYSGSALLHEVIENYLAEARPKEAADFFMQGHFEGPIT